MSVHERCAKIAEDIGRSETGKYAQYRRNVAMKIAAAIRADGSKTDGPAHLDIGRPTLTVRPGPVSAEQKKTPVLPPRPKSGGAE